MAELPTRTMTFLFTDIVGSTAIAQQFSDALPRLLTRHHEILRGAAQTYHGHVFRIVGDAFQIAFNSANDALNAALAAQTALQHEGWQPTPINVRMGIHTGSVQVETQPDGSEDYSGYLTLTRAQRVMSVANGGQVLLSSAAKELVFRGLPMGVTLRDLGEHRLKGLDSLEYLWQPIKSGLRLDFPPLSSLAASSNNLPAQPTPFVGRDEELATIATLLNDPNIRLVTLVGPGGIGKTRLALQAAEEQIGRYEHGLFFVSLAPISSSDLLASTIANAMQFVFYGSEKPDVQLVNHLRKKQMLLVLDNFEHLLDGASLVSEILEAAPGVKVLATSRESLNLSRLDFPDWETSQDAFEYSAVKLFMQSARRVLSGVTLAAADLKYVARICRLVEGVPLGILLAAAWIKTLSLGEIAAEIGQNLDFLESEQRDLPARHRSIRAVFDTTWDRLTDAERDVFMKLSVFRGGFTREAVQAVTGTSLKVLASLVNKSLVRRDPAGRYEVHELLRQYAARQLDASPQASADARDRHCRYYADFMERQSPVLNSRHVKAALNEIETDFENIRDAWHTLLENGQAAAVRKTEISLAYFLFFRARFQDAFELFRQAVEALRSAAPGEENDIARGLALAYLGVFHTSVGLFEQCRALPEEGLALLRRHHCPQETTR